MKKITTRQLTESAILIALATVLSMLKIDMPMGGGMTICSMLPIVIVGYRYDWKWGAFTGFVYSLLQLLLGLDNVRYASSAIMALGIILFDYVVAYTVIGFAAFFGGKPSNTRKALAIGICVSFVLRFLCHFITGMWIWDALWPNEFGMAPAVYSLVYNGWYMAGELALTLAVAMAIYKPLEKYITGRDLA